MSVGVFRLGWYGGTGARLVARWKDLSVAPQPEPTVDASTGLIVARWSTLLRITIPEDWVSGIYIAELYPRTGNAEYTTFIVREPTPQAPILWLSPVTTHEAYNNWGGKSLYHDNSSGAVTLAGDTRAVAVSFDRPYAEYRGAGRVLRWEYPFLRWMEGAGYDVGYAADLDLARNPGIVAGRKLIVIVGHPEYWSAGMRSTLEAAIAAGTNVAFFSSNEMYWQVNSTTRDRTRPQSGGRSGPSRATGTRTWTRSRPPTPPTLPSNGQSRRSTIRRAGSSARCTDT